MKYLSARERWFECSLECFCPKDGGRAVITPLLYGPVDSSRLSSRDFFQRDELLQSECDVDLVMVTAQLPADANVPLGTLHYMYMYRYGTRHSRQISHSEPL